MEDLDLTERQLSALNAELQVRKRGTGVAYMFWFFLGSLGAHKFYLGRQLGGWLYVAALLTGWALGFLPYLAMVVAWIWDGISLAAQVTESNRSIKRQIANEIRASHKQIESTVRSAQSQAITDSPKVEENEGKQEGA